MKPSPPIAPRVERLAERLRRRRQDPLCDVRRQLLRYILATHHRRETERARRLVDQLATAKG